MKQKKETVTRLKSSYVEKYDAYIERQKRKKQRLVRRLVLLSLVLIIITGSLASYHVKQRMVRAEKEEQYEELENKLASLEREEENYNEEIDLLNNKEYVLEIARTNYFFSKDGELIFKIFDEDLTY